MTNDATFDLGSTGVGDLAVAVAVVLTRFANSERAVVRRDGIGEIHLSVGRADTVRRPLRQARSVRDDSVVVEVTGHDGQRHQAAIRPLTPASAKVTWNPTRFPDASLDDRTARVLQAVRLRPGTPVRELPVLTRAELDHHDQLSRVRSWSTGIDIDVALRRHGARQPQAPAVVEGGRVTTYAELDEAVTAFARGLAARVDGQTGVVALALPRSLGLTVAILGSIRAGVTFTATGTRTPPERSGILAGIVNASLRVTDAPMDASAIPQATVCEIIADGANRTSIRRAASNPAYVMFTSGSTGRPKGVVVAREAMAVYLEAVIAAYDLRADDRVLQVAEPGFDVLLEEILPTIAVGATVVVAGPDCLESSDDFNALVTSAEVTVLNLSSSLWTTVYRNGTDAGFSIPPDCLRLIVIGSERVPASAYLAWRRAEPPVRLVNAYGTTETTITSVTCELDNRASDVVDRLGVVPIGLPLGNCAVRIVDRFGDPTPFGVPAELVVGGRSLFTGYVGAKPRAAAEYHTGDLVCLDRTGLLAHLGRLDGQLKIRGHRVEPAEIESALEALPGVTRAACAAAGSDDAVSLAAVVVPAPGAVLNGLEIRSKLAQRLPDWLVPNHVIVVTSLPLNDHGTVDRNWLRAQLNANGPTMAALSATEQAVAARVAQMLGRPVPAPTDNFFMLGGNSLQAIRLVAQLAKEFGIAMTARQVVLTPTIREIATWLDAAVAIGGDQIGRRAERGVFPITPGQRAMLRFLGPADSPRPYFEMWEGFRLVGSLNMDALRWALSVVVEENEALRTVVHGFNGQRVLSGPPPPSRFVDLSQLSEPARCEAVERELSFARRPFDLTTEAAFRPVIMKLGAEESVLSLTMHHLFFDGWSFGLLNERLGELYGGFPAVKIHAARPDFGDYAIWLERRATNEARAADLLYWREQLVEYKPVELLARDLSTNRSATVASYTLDPLCSAGVDALAISCAATPFAVLAAAFVTVLGDLMGRTDLVFASNDANRYHTSAEGIVGYLATTQLTRVRLGDAGSFRSLVAGIHASFTAGRQHTSLHWEDLLRELGLQDAAQFRFSLQDTPTERALVLPGLVVEPLAEAAATSGRRPVAVTAWRREHGYEIQWHSRDDLGLDLSSDHAATAFARTAADAVDDPDRTIPAFQRRRQS